VSLILDLIENNANRYSVFWANCGLSILQNGKFMDMVEEGKLIHIHRASVNSLGSHSVNITNDKILPCDAIVFATGWKLAQTSIFPTLLLQNIGFPTQLEQQSLEDNIHWDELDRKSDASFKSKVPMLADPPPEVVEYDRKHTRSTTTTPFRLFRDIAPPKMSVQNDRSLIVLGTLINTSVPTYAEISSLWGVAYLENLPFSPATAHQFTSLQDMEDDISLMRGYGNVRTRDTAAKFLDGSELIQDFTDVLMKDLGLRPDRKRLASERRGWRGLFGFGSWIKEWFSPYQSADYRGVVEEYKQRWGIE
jgi:dimethylaniline monooxygenase (N-oxide forming)